MSSTERFGSARDTDFYSSDPAHLFMQLYDELPERIRRSRELIGWHDDPMTTGCVDRIEAVVRHDGIASYPQLAEIAVWPGERGVFTIMLGLDRALWYANPWSTVYDQGGLTHVASRYVETGMLNDPKKPPAGALLPRCTIPGRPLGGSEWQDFFAVHRALPEEWDNTLVDHGHILYRFDPGFGRGQPVPVACVPFLETYKEMGLKYRRANSTYYVKPVCSPNVRDRITTLINKMDANGARIGVVPEGCLSDELLEEWTTTARETFKRGKSLRWLLLGSGPLGDPTLHVNRTVLIDRPTGEKLLVHDKRYRFTIDIDQIEEWALPWGDVKKPVREDIDTGKRIALRDSTLGRVAALICEDLAQFPDWSPELARYGVSHLLVPEFSKPIQDHSWDVNRAKDVTTHLGAWAVVSNSLAVAKAIAKKNKTSIKDSRTCVVVGPGDPDRRRWKEVAQVQFGQAAGGDDLGWYGTAGVLPFVLAAWLNPSWFGPVNGTS